MQVDLPNARALRTFLLISAMILENQILANASFMGEGLEWVELLLRRKYKHLIPVSQPFSISTNLFIPGEGL